MQGTRVIHKVDADFFQNGFGIVLDEDTNLYCEAEGGLISTPDAPVQVVVVVVDEELIIAQDTIAVLSDSGSD